MKKLIAVAALITSACAWAESTVEGANTFGILRVDSSAAETIIAVPWLGASTSETSIKVTDVVKTANLNKDDELYYYDGSAYKCWKLDANKEWQAAKIVGMGEAGDNTTSLVRGNAIILKRNAPIAEAIYLYGQVASSGSVDITITQGTAATPAYTLLEPPNDTNTSLNSGTWSNVDANDMIIVDGVDNALRYNATEGKWGIRTIKGYDKQTGVTYEWSYTSSTIPVGKGAWYISSKTGDNAPKWALTDMPNTGN